MLSYITFPPAFVTKNLFILTSKYQNNTGLRWNSSKWNVIWCNFSYSFGKAYKSFTGATRIVSTQIKNFCRLVSFDFDIRTSEFVKKYVIYLVKVIQIVEIVSNMYIRDKRNFQNISNFAKKIISRDFWKINKMLSFICKNNS